MACRHVAAALSSVGSCYLDDQMALQGAYKQRLASSMLSDDKARILSFKHKVRSSSTHQGITAAL